ncbi:MAG: hypothetical protein JXB07_19130 [Anaerolineae bacterium]|nr:hypothetical protein [Anaerolineae bacterium]
MENFVIWAILAVVVVLLVIVVILILLQPAGGNEARQLKQGWSELARRTSMRFTPPGQTIDTASVRGYYRGYPMTLRLRLRTALGRDTQTIITYTRVEVSVKNQRRIYARLYKKGAFKHTDRAFGVPNVTFGIAELDKRFEVKSSPAEFVPRLIAARKQILQHLLMVRTEHNVGVEMEGDAMIFEQQGIETSPDYLSTILDLLAEFADAVEHGE